MILLTKNNAGWYTMEEIKKAFLEYITKSPLWIICLALLFIEGHLILVLIYGYNMKMLKKIQKIGKFIIPLAISIAFSGIIFFVQNFWMIIESKMTLELMENNMLSSIVLSLAIVGAISMVILPIRERKRVRGDNRNNESEN